MGEGWITRASWPQRRFPFQFISKVVEAIEGPVESNLTRFFFTKLTLTDYKEENLRGQERNKMVRPVRKELEKDGLVAWDGDDVVEGLGKRNEMYFAE